MGTSIFDHRRMRLAVILLLLAGALCCIFPTNHTFMLFLTQNAAFVAFTYLAMGLVFFLRNRTRYMFVCMGCSAAICFYHLETSTNHAQNIFEATKINAPIDSPELKKPIQR